jgi:hypothetical protein
LRAPLSLLRSMISFVPQPDYWKFFGQDLDRWRAMNEDPAIDLLFAVWVTRQVTGSQLTEKQVLMKENLAEAMMRLVEAREELRKARSKFLLKLRREYVWELHKAFYDRTVDFSNSWYGTMERLLAFSSQFAWLFPSDAPNARSVDKFLGWLSRLQLGPSVVTIEALAHARRFRTITMHGADAPASRWMTYAREGYELWHIRVFGYGKVPSNAEPTANEDGNFIAESSRGDWFIEAPDERVLTNETANVVWCVLAHISSCLSAPFPEPNEVLSDPPNVTARKGSWLSTLDKGFNPSRSERRKIAREIRRDNAQKYW